MKINPDKIQKILFISLSNMGDAILTTPCLDLTRRFFKRAKITVMVGPRAREVFEGHPQADQLMVYDKQASLREKMALMLKLREQHFDLVIDLKHTWIPVLIRPRYATPLFRKKGEGHAVRRHLANLKAIGIEGSCGFVFPERMEDRKKVEKILSDQGIPRNSYAVLAPGAASSLKRWPIEKFKQLAEKLKSENSLPVIIVGASSDQKEFENFFPSSEWLNLTGEFSLMELGELLKGARLLITNDSGPMHLGAAWGTPTLALFGPTDLERYGPYGSMHRVVRLDLRCSPCMAATCRIKTRECLDHLEVDPVYQTVGEMLLNPVEMARSCFKN
ncbi:MAG: glycosyltransferase family 9 protein [Chlamydiae bacterium]|nr:glycosyltransferase family 9 protein [Chlamydiota bacterium]MBI3265965.1 glycosyltransferase family 9 protein [Chlamydiota bacterium]